MVTGSVVKCFKYKCSKVYLLRHPRPSLTLQPVVLVSWGDRGEVVSVARNTIVHDFIRRDDIVHHATEPVTHNSATMSSPCAMQSAHIGYAILSIAPLQVL